MDSCRKPEQPNTIVVAVALFLAMAVLFWPVFFQGKVLVPGDIPNTDPFIAYGTSRGTVAPKNTLLSDQIEQFYVYHRVATDALARDGRLPLWNPYIFTGQPLVANSQSSLFYPPNLLLRFLSPGKVATVRVFFNLLFAGLFTFLFCRQLSISARGSFLSALAFAFSGPMIVWVGYPLANVVACLPFLLWAGEKLLWRRDLPAAALLGGGMGLSLLAGHPETTFQVLAVFSLYFLARVILLKEGRGSKLYLFAGFLLAVLVGALLSGIQLVPFLDFMRESSTFARGGRGHAGGGNPFYSPEWLANLATGFTLLCPNFFGNPLDHNYIWPSEIFQNYNEQSVYFGLVPLSLAVCALFSHGRRRRLMLVASLALFCIAVAWRLPGFEIVSHLPVFSMAPNKRLRLPFALLGAVLAGYGYDAVVRHLQTCREERKSLYAAGAVLLAAVLLFVWIVAARLTVGPAVPADSFRHFLLYDVFAFDRWRTFLPLGIALCAAGGYLLCRSSEPLRRHFPTLLIALTAIELGALAWGYNPAVDEAEILPPAPAVDLLKNGDSQPFRILTTDGVFYPNFGAAYGIADVAGYDVPVYQSYSDLYLRQGGRSFGQQIDSRQQWEPEWPLINFLNVKYVISPRDLPAERFRPVSRVAVLNFQARSADLRIYENRQALPRAFMVYASEVVPDRKAALARILDRSFDFGSKVLLEEALPLPAGPAGTSSVQSSRYSNDEVVLKVRSDRPGILVMSDLFTPDWRAQIDGRPGKLYRANYAYRAVSVPQGEHVVTFSYEPSSYKTGASMTLAGLVVLALAAILAWRQRGRF